MEYNYRCCLIMIHSHFRLVALKPSIDGGICIARDGIVTVQPLPVLDDELDLYELKRIIEPHRDAHFFIEKIHLAGTAKKNDLFRAGKAWGAVLGMLQAYNATHEEVSTALLRKEMLKDTLYTQSVASKAYAKVTQLQPGLNYKRKPEDKNPDMGLVWAVLLAYYAVRSIHNQVDEEDLERRHETDKAIQRRKRAKAKLDK